jgi:micrococcal nuclease
MTTALTATMFGMSHPMITAVLAGIVAGGGVYGPYSVQNTARGMDSAVDTVRVAAVLDGDTFTLENGTLVRIAEIDAPEKKTCGADEATEALRRAVLGKSVRLIHDIDGQDDFGRIIRHVLVDVDDPRRKNIQLQEYLLQHGLVRYVPRENKLYAKELAAAELHARSRLLGLWSTCAQDDAKKTAEEKAANTDEHVLPKNPNCLIKGNISETRFGKKYTLPTCRDYDRIKVSPKKGEGYFCSEKEAQKAGFVKSGVCL